MTTIFRRTPRQRRAAKARAQVAQRLAAADSVAERIVADVWRESPALEQAQAHPGVTVTLPVNMPKGTTIQVSPASERIVAERTAQWGIPYDTGISDQSPNTEGTIVGPGSRIITGLDNPTPIQFGDSPASQWGIANPAPWETLAGQADTISRDDFAHMGIPVGPVDITEIQS